MKSFSDIFLKKFKRCENCQQISKLLLLNRFTNGLFSIIPLDIFKIIYFMSLDHNIEIEMINIINSNNIILYNVIFTDPINQIQFSRHYTSVDLLRHDIEKNSGFNIKLYNPISFHNKYISIDTSNFSFNQSVPSKPFSKSNSFDSTYTSTESLVNHKLSININGVFEQFRSNIYFPCSITVKWLKYFLSEQIQPPYSFNRFKVYSSLTSHELSDNDLLVCYKNVYVSK